MGLPLNLNVCSFGVPREPPSVSQAVERIFVKQFSRRRLKDPATLRERRARTRASTRRSGRDLVRFTERNPRTYQRYTRDSAARKLPRPKANGDSARWRRTVFARDSGRPHYLGRHPLRAPRRRARSKPASTLPGEIWPVDTWSALAKLDFEESRRSGTRSLIKLLDATLNRLSIYELI